MFKPAIIAGSDLFARQAGHSHFPGRAGSKAGQRRSREPTRFARTSYGQADMTRVRSTTLRERLRANPKYLLAVGLLAFALTASNFAAAQEVRMFDDTPSVEELRQVLAPEPQPAEPATHGLTRSLPVPGGLTRRIEILRRDTISPPSAQPIEP